jgi:hypothetical protein
MEEINLALSKFNKIQLNELGKANLMERVDTKFVIQIKDFPNVLCELTSKYNILEVNSQLINSYKSLYFDTANFSLYHDHHNRKDHRFKVRYRTYLNGNLSFLEIKEKRKGVTDKKRIQVDTTNSNPFHNENHSIFLNQHLPPDKLKLSPVLWSTYERITLVEKNQTERVTLDLNIGFEWDKNSVIYSHFIIAELKQKKQTHLSYFYQLMKNKGIRPYRISKYCLGILNLHKSKSIKHNRFKKKLLKLNINL